MSASYQYYERWDSSDEEDKIIQELPMSSMMKPRIRRSSLTKKSNEVQISQFVPYKMGQNEINEAKISDITASSSIIATASMRSLDIFDDMKPTSMIFHGEKLVINEQSYLFKRLDGIKKSQSAIIQQTQATKLQLGSLYHSLKQYNSQKGSFSMKWKQIEKSAEQIQQELRKSSENIQLINQRINKLLQKSVNTVGESEYSNQQSLIVFGTNICMEVESSQEGDHSEQDCEQKQGIEKSVTDQTRVVESMFVNNHQLLSILEDRKQLTEIIKKSPVRREAGKKLQSFVHCQLTMKPQYCQQLHDFVCEEYEHFRNWFVELLYRRTPDDEGRDYGESEDILNKSGILLIARTQAGNIVGGYLGKELLMNKDTPDQKAFIFTIQDGWPYKFKVLKNAHKHAAFASKYSLISFGRDLMISQNCLKDMSMSQWPSSYEDHWQNVDRKWFAGGSQFKIVAIEVYEITVYTDQDF